MQLNEGCWDFQYRACNAVLSSQIYLDLVALSVVVINEAEIMLITHTLDISHINQVDFFFDFEWSNLIFFLPIVLLDWLAVSPNDMARYAGRRGSDRRSRFHLTGDMHWHDSGIFYIIACNQKKKINVQWCLITCFQIIRFFHFSLWFCWGVFYDLPSYSDKGEFISLRIPLWFKVLPKYLDATTYKSFSGCTKFWDLQIFSRHRYRHKKNPYF